jgi:DNA-binding transcriptional regulator YhcF (GntR family)
LGTGAQLPTVQELSDRLGVARGTVKRAYDELEHEGIIEKVRGRGTFICQQRLDSASRKDRAMAAIDDLLDSLEEMGFSAGEVNIFLDLKLRQRMEQVSLLKVAVLDCNPESLSQMAEQLRDVGNIEVYSYLVDNAMEYPYSMAEEMDLIVTTTAHAALLSQVLPEKEKLVRIALRPNPRCLSRIIRMRQGIVVGIVSHSERFGKILQETCQTYNHSVSLSEPVLFSQITDWDAWLSDKDAVLLPKAYERYAGNGTENLRQFGERKKLIPCDYEMDEGSFLYLEERIRRAQEEKTI